MTRSARSCFTIAVLIAAMFVGSLSVPAAACACGALVTPDQSTRVAQETALVSTDGRTETIVMRLGLESSTDNAALLMPTPTPAKVTTASASLFDELEKLTAPRVEVKRRWRFGAKSDEVMASAPPGGPRVVDQVQLGPLEATTLAGGDLPGIQNWLSTHGYSMRPDVVAALEPYLKEGWAVVAMRLTSSAPLKGPLDPVRLDFASDRLVYPMRLSTAATSTQRVLVYTLGAHRMQRTDPDTGPQRVSVEFAGSIADRTSDPTLTELSSRGDYLTRMSVVISDPHRITSDFLFGPAPTDEPFQRVTVREESEDLAPVVFTAAAGFIALAVLASAVGALVFVVLRRRRRV